MSNSGTRTPKSTWARRVEGTPVTPITSIDEAGAGPDGCASRRFAVKIRVYLATTQGAVMVERISREPPPQSAICLKRTTKVLPVSSGYDAFVRQPSGVIEREFGPFNDGGFRLDVSSDVADGESWQLGVFVAHALKEAGELAGAEDTFDEVWWLTGEVDNDLNVMPVGHIPDKIRTAAVDIAAMVDSGTPVTLFLSEENLASIDRGELPYGIRVVGVTRTAEVIDGVGHATPPPILESVRRLYVGLQSFRSMSRMDASLMKASALRLRFSQSLASRRQRLSQAMVRSTTQRLGWTTKPFTRSDRLTISVSRSGRMPARAR